MAYEHVMSVGNHLGMWLTGGHYYWAAKAHMRHLTQDLRQELQTEEYDACATAIYDAFTRTMPAPPAKASGQALNREPFFGTVNLDTFLAGKALLAAGLQPCVLNMANELNCGGSWCYTVGSQEEALFRCSSLPLSLWPRRSLDDRRLAGFVERQEQFFPLSEAGAIYSPKVIVTRDGHGRLLATNDRFTLSVVSAAAEDLRFFTPGPTRPDETLTREKMRSILHTAHKHGHDAVVLGAFGCGAFLHDPVAISSMFGELLSTEFKNCFRAVLFAVLCSSPSSKNLLAFGDQFPVIEVAKSARRQEQIATVATAIRASLA